MKAAVVGASGYAGMELVRIVMRHPHLELAAVTSEQRAGQELGRAFPAFRGLTDLVLEAVDPGSLAGRVDVAFTALPHAASAPTVAALHEAGVAVVDISADFRLRDRDVYTHWYGEHKAPELFGQAVYGLPEIYAEKLRGARLIAAPGCYPTGALLPLLPFAREGWVEGGHVFIDSKSGVSGAGRAPQEAYMFSELDENVKAYKVAAHRHGPEIEQEASLVAGEPIAVTFIPHLVPAIRGIATSVLVRSSQRVSQADAHALLAQTYADAPFVRVLDPGESPSLSAVRGSNFCDVNAFVDERHGHLVLLSAIDNLVKGAGGQGVQCFNLAQGWPETSGLLEAPTAP